MTYTLHHCNPGELYHSGTLAGYPAPNPATIAHQQADAHWLLYDAGGYVRARCSLWWHATPVYAGRTTGFIGHYAAHNPSAGAHLLMSACAHLAAQGCHLAVGPIDGSTWYPYRLVSERGTEPPFFLEPDTPDEWLLHFQAGGFTPLAHYTSAITTDLIADTPRGQHSAARMATRGLRVRSLTADDVASTEQYTALLRNIYRVALVSFRHNLLHTPISEEAFLARYAELQPSLQPDLLQVVEHTSVGEIAAEMVGFLFALPDWAQEQRGQAIDTCIIKTLAILPTYQGLGIGTVLLEQCHKTAAALGYRRAIHALMREGNTSRSISTRYAQTMRRYTLFAKEL